MFVLGEYNLLAENISILAWCTCSYYINEAIINKKMYNETYERNEMNEQTNYKLLC